MPAPPAAPARADRGCGALGDHRLGRVGGGLLAQPGVLALESHQLHRPRHLGADLVVVERLGDVVEGAGAHRLHRRRHVGIGRYHHERQLAVACLHLAQQLEPVHHRHAAIRHHDVGAPRLEREQRLDAVPGALALEAGPLERRPQTGRHARLVVDDEDPCLHRAATDGVTARAAAAAAATAARAGKTIEKRAPPASLPATSTLAPCARAICCTTARPSPWPSLRVE